MLRLRGSYLIIYIVLNTYSTASLPYGKEKSKLKESSKSSHRPALGLIFKREVIPTPKTARL